MKSGQAVILFFILVGSVRAGASANVKQNFKRVSVTRPGTVSPRSFDTAILDKIKERALATKSEELFILHARTNGQAPQIIAQTSQSKNGSAIRTVQSVTKTIAALTYLLLMREGRVESLDVPLSKFYPEMASDERRDLTVRAVLTHSTGLIDPENLWNMTDLMAGILKLKPTYPVFTQFAYSNAAAELMGNILDQLVPPSRDPKIDPVVDFLSSKVLSQIGVRDLSWSRDPQGHLQTSGGVYTSSHSLALLGLFLFQKGKVDGKTVIEPEWLDALSNSRVGLTHCYALMTWKVGPSCGSRAGSVDESVVADAKKNDGFYMDGFGGQYVVIIPERGIVAVRMRQPLDGATVPDQEEASFLDFPDLVSRL
jgi:CubicO group peptidase (beta-lactamase class C family)